MENTRKHININLVAGDNKNQLVSEPNYHMMKWLSEKLLVNEIKKSKIKKNKSVNLGFSILEVSKTLMHKFLYYYLKPKYQDNSNLCCKDTGSFSVHIKTEDVYRDIINGV